MQPEAETTLSAFVEAWELFREPILAESLVGAVLGLVGIYVVARRMVFLSAALTQCAGFGVALALFAQASLGATVLLASPRWAALVVTIVTAGLLSLQWTSSDTRRDGWLGFAFLFGAAGTLALASRLSSGSQEIQSVLFGSAVAILPEDLRAIGVSSIVLLSLHLWWRRGFLQVSLDPEGAQVRGLPVRLLEVLLLLSLALAISLFTQIVGALPVFAFSVLPAIAALRVSPNVDTALVLAAGVGAVAAAMGYAAAFVYDLPVGTAQCLTALAFVVVSELLRLGAKRLAPKSSLPGEHRPRQP